MKRIVFALCLTVVAQTPDEIRTRMTGLEKQSDPDIAIFVKAADWALRHPEEKTSVLNTLALLDLGKTRASRNAVEQERGRVPRGYRSRVDGSVQPYLIHVPESYDPKKPSRLDVVLHGRATGMTEVSFLTAKKTEPKQPDYLVLEVFGRTNNAYRWAGETDVFEALDAVRKHYNVDPDHIYLRGFSMGGAGAWHIGLHYPDRWAGMEAGAGFVETVNYAKRSDVPEWERSAMHIYDALDYAPNAVDLAVVGYGGEIDPQLKASTLIREAVENLPGLNALFLVGPQTAHKFHPDSKARSEEFLNKQTRHAPEDLRFTTYTARYDECFGVKIVSLQKMYEKASVERKGSAVTTSNVVELEFAAPFSGTIDGQEVGQGTRYAFRAGKWRKVGSFSGLRKRHGLQGPIDDAFMDSFVTVNPPEEFRSLWDKWMRGTLPEGKPDASRNVVVFGDYTDPYIAKALPKLPVKWTRNEISVAGQKFASEGNTLALIYPNPQNPSHYLVLNSGHTFGEKDFIGTNALLYPRLGDWAVIRKADHTVVASGFFNADWK